jgi:hypothetical protein
MFFNLTAMAITLPTVKYCINKENWALAKKLFDSLLVEVEKSTDC